MSDDEKGLVSHRLLKEITEQGLTVDEAIDAIRNFASDKKFDDSIREIYNTAFKYKC